MEVGPYKEALRCRTQVRLAVNGQLTTAQRYDPASADGSRFAALIPAGELAARVALGDDDDAAAASDACVWELIHCRSQTDGRPETVFQLAWYTPVLLLEIRS